MITYERSNGWKIATAALVVALGASGGYWWMRQDGNQQASAPVANVNKGGVNVWSRAASGAEGAEMTLKPALMQDGRPVDVSAEDWNMLNAALKKIGAKKGEAERIVSYLRYQHQFESWQSLDETKDAQKRRRMAQTLLSELPDRLGAGEFTPIEANLMSAVLFADIEPDEGKRAKLLEEQQAKLNAIAPLNEDEQAAAAKARQTELQRRQATAFGDWQAKTDPADHTQAKLDQSMEEVRRAYNSGEF